MGINDRIDNESEDRKDFLCKLVAGIDLDDTLYGITMQVIDRGEASLSPKQGFQAQTPEILEFV
jgi:hypothetical protein